MSRPPHPPWFNHPNNIRWRIYAKKFSETFSSCSSLKVRDQVSHPHSTTAKIKDTIKLTTKLLFCGDVFVSMCLTFP
jgi:hypothetical protein